MTRLKELILLMLASVRDFRTVSGYTIADRKRNADHIEELLQEHIWVKEEWIELWNAVKVNDRVEIADAYCDIIYFALGAMLKFGRHLDVQDMAIDRRRIGLCDHVSLLNNVNIVNEDEFLRIVYVAIYAFENKFPDVSIERCFMEVHRANMSKFCRSIQQAEETRQKYAKQGKETEIHRVSKTHWVVKNRVDGKTLKSVDWVAPNLLKYLG